jgi:hypothetical protein
VTTQSRLQTVRTCKELIFALDCFKAAPFAMTDDVVCFSRRLQALTDRVDLGFERLRVERLNDVIIHTGPLGGNDVFCL